MGATEKHKLAAKDMNACSGHHQNYSWMQQLFVRDFLERLWVGLNVTKSRLHPRGDRSLCSTAQSLAHVGLRGGGGTPRSFGVFLQFAELGIVMYK